MKYILPIFFALLLIGCDSDDDDLDPVPGGGGGTNPNTESGFPPMFFQADLDGESFLLEADHEENMLVGMMAHQTDCEFNYGMNISNANDLNDNIFSIMHYIGHTPPNCVDSVAFEGIWSPGSINFSEMEDGEVGQGVLITYKPAGSATNYSSAHGSQSNDASYVITEVIPLGEDYISTLFTFGTFVGLKGNMSCTLYSPNDPTDTIELTNGEFYTLVQGIY